jgi:hypothetical protein
MIQEEINRRLDSGNACYHSAQNFCFLVCCLKTYLTYLLTELRLPSGAADCIATQELPSILWNPNV